MAKASPSSVFARARPKRTPCVGICSTTYGDLVCRGCKRFAHEIVQWNSYDELQQEQIWRRLQEIRDASVLHHLRIQNREEFDACAANFELSEALSEGELRYEALRHLVVKGLGLIGSGLVSFELIPDDTPQDILPALDSEALTVMRALDAEIYRRSIAYYERCFRVPV
ncbi:MAG: DUF1289 domain-containing protein [Pseudomonadota bacterium]